MTRPARIVRAIPADDTDAPPATAPLDAAGRHEPALPSPAEAAVEADALVADHDAHTRDLAITPSAELDAPPTKRPDKGRLVRELKELAGNRAHADGQRLMMTVTRPAQRSGPSDTPKQHEPTDSALISELVDLARNGGRRDAERVQEEITPQMERFRDKYRDMPGHE